MEKLVNIIYKATMCLLEKCDGGALVEILHHRLHGPLRHAATEHHDQILVAIWRKALHAGGHQLAQAAKVRVPEIHHAAVLSHRHMVDLVVWVAQDAAGKRARPGVRARQIGVDAS